VTDTTTDTTGPVPASWDELDAWLDTIPPIPRARLLAVLVDATTGPRLAVKRRAAVAEAASGGYGTAAEVAAELGMSVNRLYKTRSAHRSEHRNQP
jgi:hypothetical protein